MGCRRVRACAPRMHSAGAQLAGHAQVGPQNVSADARAAGGAGGGGCVEVRPLSHVRMAPDVPNVVVESNGNGGAHNSTTPSSSSSAPAKSQPDDLAASALHYLYFIRLGYVKYI